MQHAFKSAVPFQSEVEIQINGLSKVYSTKSGDFQALEDTSLHVNKEEFVSILGPISMVKCQR
jgi:ABC-type Fe3+/spermidine/putrescine transport system ATPase subunit